MYYMVYHVTYHETKKIEIVDSVLRETLLASGEWFNNLQDARKTFDDEVAKIEKKEIKQSAKRANKNNNIK